MNAKLYTKSDEELACNISLSNSRSHKKNYIHKSIGTPIFKINEVLIYNYVNIAYNKNTNKITVSCFGLRYKNYSIHPTTNKKLKCKCGIVPQHAIDVLHINRRHIPCKEIRKTLVKYANNI
jgi:hypothetical protein